MVVQETLEHIKIIRIGSQIMSVQCHFINVGKQTMKPLSVDTRDKCSAIPTDLKVINHDDALINRNLAMVLFQSNLDHVKTDFLVRYCTY